ncbi:zinc finger protein [Saccharopolyspora pogona]|uniref:zinc finger protein n=1 Tax=Saccharopolyspora pogona TaxID=333966 RepID=UPI0016848EEA|nr:zinc finger protein [Saccharopolyspora pogona]
MLPGGAKIGRWQPVSGGRHAFDSAARNAGPGPVVKALCGVEVSTDELQRIAPEIAWIRESTCMAFWQVLASRQ